MPVTRRYRFTPERIGRHSDIKPFTVIIENADDEDAQKLAEGLHGYAKQYLLSKEFSTDVDLHRGTWVVSGGRHGKGTIALIEERTEEKEAVDA